MDVDKAFEEQRDALADEVRAMLRSEKLRSVQIQASKTSELRVLSESVQAKDKVVSFIKTNYANWQTRTEAGALVIKPSEAYVSEFQSTTLKQNLKIMRDRIEELGITEALVQRQGAHSIRIELPGARPCSSEKCDWRNGQSGFLCSESSGRSVFVRRSYPQ